jgi:hypothetical protein
MNRFGLLLMVTLLIGCPPPPVGERKPEPLIGGEGPPLVVPDTIVDSTAFLALVYPLDSTTLALPLEPLAGVDPTDIERLLRDYRGENKGPERVFTVPESTMRQVAEVQAPPAMVLLASGRALGVVHRREFAFVHQPMRQYPAALFAAPPGALPAGTNLFLASPFLYRNHGTRLRPVPFDTAAYAHRLLDTLNIRQKLHAIHLAAARDEERTEVFAAVSWQDLPDDTSEYFLFGEPSRRLLAKFDGDSLVLLQPLADRADYYLVELMLLPLAVNGDPVLAVTKGVPQTDNLVTMFYLMQGTLFAGWQGRTLPGQLL